MVNTVVWTYIVFLCTDWCVNCDELIFSPQYMNRSCFTEKHYLLKLQLVMH